MKRIRFDTQTREFYVEQTDSEGNQKVLSRSKKGTSSLFRKHPDLLEES